MPIMITRTFAKTTNGYLAINNYNNNNNMRKSTSNETVRNARPPHNANTIVRHHPNHQRNYDTLASAPVTSAWSSTSSPLPLLRTALIVLVMAGLLPTYVVATENAIVAAQQQQQQQQQPRTAALAAPVAASSILEQFSPNCTAVTHVFVARGIEPTDIPQKPSNEMVLHYCESPSVGTCCTYSMESKMATQSRGQLEKQTREQISKMSTTMAVKAQRFNEIFGKLLSTSREEFHKMFTRTYGVIYQQNSYVFSDLFKEFESYYENGRVNLIDVMDKFFNVLYQKMFEVLNSQYSFDPKYISCVSKHMKDLKPFGDVPEKLSLQVKRSFVATRTYGQALATAAEVSKKLVNVRLNSDCMAALTKMQHCGACKGYSEKPCTNYCVNVIKGCLHYFNELDIEWENFVGAMDKLSERLLSSFNIVNVVEPINIKISEAIMNFQESGHDITSRVFQGCGHPKLGRSKRAVSPKFVSAAHNPTHTLSVASAVDPITFDSDILDIDATIDEAYVLREKRAADPGARDSDDQTTTNGSRPNNSGNNRGGRGGNQKRKQSQRKNDDNDFAGREQGLEKMVREIRQRVKESKKFWSTLPHQLCTNDEIASSSDVDGMCWNGHTIDRYMHSVTTEHSRNPEFPDNPATPRQTAQVATQLYYLKNAIGHLRNAYNGMDVNWSEQDDVHYGSGSGSGSGSEDDEDDTEGSGMGGGAVPPFVPGHKQPDTTSRGHVDDEDEEDVEDRGSTILTHTTRPKFPGEPKITSADTNGNRIDSDGVRHGHNNNNNNDEDDDDETHGGAGAGGAAEDDDHVGNGNGSDDDNDGNDDDDDGDADLRGGSKGSGATKPQKMSLRRALVLYLVPLYMAWFGGLCADLL